MLPNPPRRLSFKRAPDAIAGDILKRLRRARRDIEQAVEAGGEKLIPTLELIEEDIGRRFTPLRHLNAVASTPEVRKAYEQVLAALTDYETWLGQHQGLCKAFKTFAAEPGFARRPLAEQALVRHALLGFRLSGADLPAAERERVRAQIAELSELGNRYEMNVLDATDAWRLSVSDEKQLRGLPEATVELLAERAREQGESGWLLTLDPGVVFDVLRHAEDRGLREAVHGAWVSRASDAGPDAGRYDNVPVIEAILKGRRHLARMLGYADYAAYALETRMAGSADEVKHFLRDLAKRAKPQAGREFAELEAFAVQEGHEDGLAAWDIAYYSEKLRKARYGFDEEAMRRYFPLERVLSGLRSLCRSLYGVRFRTDRDAPVWHEDARVWALLGPDGRRIGRLYLDLYARPGKRGGAWMDEGGHRLRLGGVSLSPAAFLNANFMRPARGRASLIAHDDVVTLCHELGHCLHHLLSTVDYPAVGGISGVEWDAVEFPSQLHEEFAWHPAGLAALSREVDTGTVLPRTLIEALAKSRRFHGALHLVRQLEFALFDIDIHTLGKDAPAIADVRRVLDGVRRDVRVTPLSELDRFECGFAHIFGGGYAAGYYSYLWAEVMARDGFTAFVRDGKLDFGAGRRLAETVLANGGSRPARELYKLFRGHDPDSGPLLALYGIN